MTLGLIFMIFRFPKETQVFSCEKSCVSIVHRASLNFRKFVYYAGWIYIQCFDDDESDDNVERLVVSKCHAHSCQTS